MLQARGQLCERIKGPGGPISLTYFLTILCILPNKTYIFPLSIDMDSKGKFCTDSNIASFPGRPHLPTANIYCMGET